MVLAQIQIYQQDTMGESQSYKHSFIRLLVPVVGEEWSHSGLWMTSPLLHIRNHHPPPFFFYSMVTAVSTALQGTLNDRSHGQPTPVYVA